MKKNLILAVSLAVTLTATAQQNGQQKPLIDLSSVDKFFELVDKISLNKEISEDDWNALFSTVGHRIVGFGRTRRNIYREMFMVAFSDNQQTKRDSILNLSAEDWENDWASLTRLTLVNFLDIKENQKELRLFRKTYDFDAIVKPSVDRLKSFLIEPVDSLIVFPSIALLCNESGYWFSSLGIGFDFNTYYNSTEEERANMMAHEMFHIYRMNFVNRNINHFFFQVLNFLQDEGIANLIDKKGVECIFELGTPQEIIDLAVSEYGNTPQILNDLDIIVNSYINKEISDEQFMEKVRGLSLSGHANGLYMSKLIRDAGFMDEMLKTFYSPVEFFKLYNKAAKKENLYVLSDEFIKFAASLEKLAGTDL
jgi:hypothetical protein